MAWEIRTTRKSGFISSATHGTKHPLQGQAQGSRVIQTKNIRPNFVFALAEFN